MKSKYSVALFCVVIYALLIVSSFKPTTTKPVDKILTTLKQGLRINPEGFTVEKDGSFSGRTTHWVARLHGSTSDAEILQKALKAKGVRLQ